MSVDFQICDYFNDHQTAASLMIDDLAPAAIAYEDELKPFYDHGYGMRKPEGLYHYFEENLLNPYPEIRGTFFILTDQHFNQKPGTKGYIIKNRGFSDEYVNFLHSLKPRFDFAFHGTTHGKLSKGQMLQEFTYLTPDDIPRYEKMLKDFQQATGLSFYGGKFPAYQKNQHSSAIIEKLNFKWWAFSNHMKNRRHRDTAFKYSGNNQRVLHMPTNFGGESFKAFLKVKKPRLTALRSWHKAYERIKLEGHLNWLYQNKRVITIQEHFTTLRSQGIFQRPNVFDDLESLKTIYATLRGADIWHASCNQVAKYRENKDHITLETNSKNLVLTYSGTYTDPAVSVKSKKVKSLKNSEGLITHGILRNGAYVFNHLKPGPYGLN